MVVDTLDPGPSIAVIEPNNRHSFLKLFYRINYILENTTTNNIFGTLTISLGDLIFSFSVYASCS